MSLQNTLIPRCRAAAVTTKDGHSHTHYCEHPLGHDGDHGARTPSGGAWLSWSHIIQTMVIPSPPQDIRCPAVAYRPETAPEGFPCSLSINHDGDHHCLRAPGNYVAWPSSFDWKITPTPSPAPLQER